MPQNAKVEPSEIRKASITRRLICGSANRSATVKRASACSFSVSVAPLFSRAVAALRCSLTRSQRSDSGIDRRIQSVRRAGNTPSRNITRHAFGPIGKMKNQATDARKNPTPKPRLHQADALAAILVGPQLGDDRGAGHPFRADGDADQEAQDRERQPVPGEGADAGHDRVGQDREQHGALAADVVGDHAADQPADAPAEQRERDHRAGVDRDLRILRRIEQLVERHADRDHQRVGLVAVEQPAEIGGDQRVPLALVERAVPGLRTSGDVGHGIPPFVAIRRWRRPSSFWRRASPRPSLPDRWRSGRDCR